MATFCDGYDIILKIELGRNGVVPDDLIHLSSHRWRAD